LINTFHLSIIKKYECANYGRYLTKHRKNIHMKNIFTKKIKKKKTLLIDGVFLHLNLFNYKDVERGQKQEPYKKATVRPHGAKGASSSNMFKYVTVETAPAAATVDENAAQPVPNKDVAASSFTFALQNVSDVIPPRVLPHSDIPVLELASKVAHDDVQIFEEDRNHQETRNVVVPKSLVVLVPPIYTIEHVDVVLLCPRTGGDFGHCLPVFLANYGLVLIITSETELEISGHVVQRF
jgi:hypothetical protein